MSRHTEMPPVPPANRTSKGVGGKPEIRKDTSPRKRGTNAAEQGATANIRQNTTNAGFYHSRRER
jgi:hypothetical protein